MRERPILFSGPMVRAILEDRKTQTRRVVKPQPFDDSCGGQPMVGHADLGGTFAPHVFGSCMARLAPCPYGVPGDRLWVRETWQPLWAEAGRAPPYGLTSPEGWAIGYPATDGIQEWHDEGEDGDLVARCNPSIHMPRWASRITLDVTDVRVERLQDISLEDVRAEGFDWRGAATDYAEAITSTFFGTWDSLNRTTAPVEANPWVWVVSFKRVKP